MIQIRSCVRLVLATSVVMGAQLAAPALADEVGRDDDLGEVLVTAEREVVLDTTSKTGSRLDLSLRETPATLDVLTQERFLERGLRTTNEALNSAPGVTAIDTGGSPGTVAMRGFGGNSVSHNYDGIHQPSTMTSRNFDSFAFERVEVLKGPASVLFGEGGIGGSINFVPKKPRPGVTEFSMLGSYGSLSTFRFAGDANVPLGEKTAVRALVSYAGSDGYIDRQESESLSANVGVTIEATERLSVFLAAEYFGKNDGPIYWGTPLVAAAVAREPTALAFNPNGQVLDRFLRDINIQNEDSKVRSDSTWLRSQVVWKINDTWTLRNDLSYNNGDRMWFDASSYSFNVATNRVNRRPSYIRNEMDFWHERLTIASDGKLFGHRNRFLFGVEHSENDHNSDRRFGIQNQVDPYNLVPGLLPGLVPANYPGAGNLTDSAAVTKVDAVFTENAFNITDELLFVVGGRYEDMSLDRTITDYNLNTVTRYGRDYNPFSYRGGLVYSVTPETQLYTQYTRGAEAVGTMVLFSLANATFDLTTGESAEVGLKSSFWNNRISTTLSGFWIRQKDIITRDPDNPNISIQGGALSSRGVEVAVSATLTPQLRLDANATLLDAKYDELLEAGGVDRKGKTPTNTPESIVNLFAVYQFNETPIKLTAGMRQMGRSFGNTANTAWTKGYTVFDASAGYTFGFGDVTLRARNLTDKFYIERGGTSTVYIGAPRTLDVTFRTKF